MPNAEPETSTEIEVAPDDLVTIDRDGQLVDVEAARLRVNDLVVIQAGDIVPADLRLVEARALEIDEFEITGELLPITKTANEEATLYQGSRVTRGAGKGIVVAIGEQTEYGQIMQQGREPAVPNKYRLVDEKLLWLAVLCLPAFAIQFSQTRNLGTLTALFVLLLMVLDFSLNDALHRRLLVSDQTRRLERAGIRFRDRWAFERLGAVGIVCFDKTGVLTTRRLDVQKLYFADRELDAASGLRAIEPLTSRLVTTACALCNDVLYYEKVAVANPIDQALIAYAEAAGIDVRVLQSGYHRIYDQPFDSEKRYMACGLAGPKAEVVYFAKGDPDVILQMCGHYVTSTGALRPVDGGFLRAVRSGVEAIAQAGDTAIALGYKSGASVDASPSGYTFLCLLQLSNDFQRATQATIRALSQRGIRSLLLTGDRAQTAAKIGADSGITSGIEMPLTGRMIERMPWTEVVRQAGYTSVFARLTPSQKGVLVLQLQRSGHCVAMVGDGPNDAIALKAADVGISFAANSSSIARRRSDILLTDLAELVDVLDSSVTIRKRSVQFKRIGIIGSAVAIVALYAWTFLAW